MRVLPVLLVAGGIAWWSQASEARCGRLFAGWAADFDRSLRDGAPRLPAPGALADPLLQSPVAAALAAGGSGAAVEPVEAPGFARVRWRDREGVSRWIELRCGGSSVEVSGVGFEPDGEESSER